MERDFNFIAANFFPDFNQIGGEVIAIDKNLSVHFETTSGQALTTTWDMNNTISLEDVIKSSQASLLQNTSSTSTSGGDREKRDEDSFERPFSFPKDKRPPPQLPPLPPKPTTSKPLFNGGSKDIKCCPLSSIPWSYGN